MPRPSRPLGTITRGTTNPNRLRRIDRWLVHRTARLLQTAADPLVVDLGYGASGVTTVELARQLRTIRDDVDVLGLEIDPARVRTARAALPRLAARLGVDPRRISFDHGGFELGPAAHRAPVLVRAANVLRQYPVAAVPPAWAQLAARLSPGGLLVDATCDEIGRRAAWITVTGDGPQALTLSLRLAGLPYPSVIAERLPKALIECNVAGNPVHDWLAALDDAWERNAGLSSFGARQRFVGSCRALRDAGWPVLDNAARWRLGEVTVAWSAVGHHPP